MTDRLNNDLAALLTPPPSKGVQFTQGVITSWERITGNNTVLWRDIPLTDVPFVEGVNNLVLKEGDVVGMLGWAPENAKGVGSWWIIGKLSNPGDFVADLTFYLGQLIIRTPDDEFAQAYFGSDTDGVPLTLLYYGDDSDSHALIIRNRESFEIADPEGHIIFANDSISGIGLGRPYLYYHLSPTLNAMIEGTVFVPSTRSAAYVDLYSGVPHVWHPRISYDIQISATGVTDWRILVNGTVVFTGSPSASGDIDIPGWGTAITPGEAVNIAIQARNTGAGFTRLRIVRFEGRSS